ncbi:hypothetical protein WA026_023424 [Henosepilachna vigintioctopunctata]|uniref:Uncharacterized protein n=1 Tax=Henosepilachna vigintioctopunctata TaxID=420089 RepID=A0AAW1TZ54_9CUCU
MKIALTEANKLGIKWKNRCTEQELRLKDLTDESNENCAKQKELERISRNMIDTMKISENEKRIYEVELRELNQQLHREHIHKQEKSEQEDIVITNVCYTHSQFLTADGRSSTTEDDPVSSCRRDYQELEEKLYNSLFRDLREQLLKELSKIVQQNTKQETTQQKSYSNARKDKELDDKIMKHNTEQENNHESNHLIWNGNFRTNKSHKNIPQETSMGMKGFKSENKQVLKSNGSFTPNEVSKDKSPRYVAKNQGEL